MIRIAVCDDNIALLKSLNEIVRNAFSVYTDELEVLSFSSGALLLNAHKQEAFHVIFLDIDMPDVSGFQVAGALRDACSSCFIIFVTSHSELVYESFDFQPFQFIRKNCSIPIEDRVNQITEKLMRHMKQNKKLVLEDRDSGRYAVYVHDIVYIEIDKHYLYYYTLQRTAPIKVRGSLKDCEEKFTAYDFVRIHKRYLINLRYLADFDGGRNEITLNGIHRKLAMSKNYKKNVDEKYTLYLRSIL